MALDIFPSSPLPGGLSRTKQWNGNFVRYDSGAGQGFTAYVQPLYRWQIPWRNIADTKQNTLAYFADTVKGNVTPFLMKDPYDFAVGSIQWVNTTQTDGDSLQTFDLRSYHIRVDTTYIGSLTSVLSGFVTLGSEYSYDQDTGVLTVNTIGANDRWSTPTTIQYFRKVHFAQDYSDTSPIWNQFQVTVVIEELV